jgi:hypothetical protein
MLGERCSPLTNHKIESIGVIVTNLITGASQGAS